MKLSQWLKLSVVTLALLGASLQTGGALANEKGNGGGGVFRNGRYMTFYSAGFYTEPTATPHESVPQLDRLIQFFSDNAYLTDYAKARYISTLEPTSGHKYYTVQSDSFTPQTRARLMAEYSRVMKVPTNDVAIFAVTDTSSKTTYLLPEFFQLNPNEQMAILFHESYWILNPNSDYQTVIDAEMSFQAYLDQPTSSPRLMDFLRHIGGNGDLLKAAFEMDSQSGALSGLLNDNQIQLKDLLGRKFMDCKERGTDDCMAFVQMHFYDLLKQYPNSALLSLFSDALEAGRFKILLDDSYDYLGGKWDHTFISFAESAYLDLSGLYDSSSKIPVHFSASADYGCGLFGGCDGSFQTAYFLSI